MINGFSYSWYNKHITRGEAEDLLKKEVPFFFNNIVLTNLYLNPPKKKRHCVLLHWIFRACSCTLAFAKCLCTCIWVHGFDTTKKVAQPSCCLLVNFLLQDRDTQLVGGIMVIQQAIPITFFFNPHGVVCHFLALRYQAKEGAFMVRDSRHAGVYTVSVFTRTPG